MKIPSVGATVLLTITLLVTCVGAREAPAIFTDGLAAPTTPFSPFAGKPGADDLFPKPGDGPAGVIDAARYVFSVPFGSPLEDMSSGTTQLIGPGTDNDNSALAPLGFLFRYDGAFFTEFSVNGNGLLRLGGLATGASNLNSISSTENAPKIMPYWDDLCVGDNGKVHYKTVGPLGDRRLVVEWKNMKITRGTGCDGTGSGTFQVWLYDRTGVIKFIYGDGMAAAAANGGYSIGLQSGEATNFASVTTSNNSVSYSAPNDTQTDAVALRLIYLFTPVMPAAPTNGIATPVTRTSVTLNWTDNANNETAYLVRRTTDHVNFYFVGNTIAPNSTTFSEDGLTPGTQYFYYINALSEGAFSPDLVIPVTTASPANLSSTAAGGPWSAPSTWAGGVVPSAGDHVAIAGGATVIIDTASAVATSVTVAGGASLKFGETAAFKLTVGQSVEIEANGVFATGNGSANQHVLTVGGSLINNGTLDFSTNNNQAAAGIVFTGSASSTFGGTGAVTDVFTITINKGSAASVLELNPSNFTVQGSSADEPSSGYLYLYKGTFKISGSFAGTHRTFASSQYQISAGTGFWLNNPNYTVAPQAYQVYNLGNFRLTAGTFAVGTGGGHSFIVLPDSFTTIEGGAMNVAGGYIGYGRFNFKQTGGILTTCTWIASPGSDGCFKTSFDTQVPASLIMAGGEIVIQNPPAASALAYDNSRGGDNATLTGGTLRFGNSQTAGTGTFTFAGSMPNLVIDTTTGGHTVKFKSSYSYSSDISIRNVNIGPGGILDTSESNTRLKLTGPTFVNNGAWNTEGSSGYTFFCDDNAQDFLYTGTGIHTGIISQAFLNCHRFTLSPTVGNLRMRNMTIYGDLVNTNKLTLGGSGAFGNYNYNIWFGPNAGTFDSVPVFDLRYGGQELAYSTPRTIGLELNPERKLSRLRIQLEVGSTSFLRVEGGDLTVDHLELEMGGIDMGNNRLIHTGDFGNTGYYNGGYVNGTIVRRFTQTGSYLFRVAVGSMYCPIVNLTSITTIPTEVSVKTVFQPMPGLDPVRSLDRHWVFEKNGVAAATVLFRWHETFANGTVANYKIWRSTGGAPSVVPNGGVNLNALSIQTLGSESILTGLWGVGEREALTSVSIGGSVLTSGGAGIRNAVVTVSGGNLPAPMEFQTGQFGAYSFSGLQPGQTYTVRVAAKRFRFTQSSQVITPLDNVANLNFTANPQEF